MSLDFTKEMKKEYTIIAPDIFPTHMELLSELFRMYGYKLEVVHYQGKDVLDMGLSFIHNNFMHLPAAISTLTSLHLFSSRPVGVAVLLTTFVF